MRRDSLGLLILVVLALAGELGPAALASDGKLEINQACAVSTNGCFPGDNGGLPIEITLPGSYIFTGDLLFTGGGSAISITINANRTFLDLGGFTLKGDSLMMNTGIQIFATDVEVKNGVITGFDAGIFAGNAHRMRLRDLSITGIDGIAISTGMTSQAWIRDSVISGNGTGIDAPGDQMMVVGCNVSNNTAGDGIRVGSRSLVADNVVAANGGDGIEIFDGSVRGNVIKDNVVGFGINLNANTLVIGNTVVGNGLMLPSGNIENTCASCLLIDNLAP